MGIGICRNRGLKAAKGKIIASLDADSVLCKGWLDRVALNFEIDPELKALSGPSYYGNVIYDLWSSFTRLPNNFTSITGFAYLGANNSAYDKEYLKEIGGWSEDLDEEMDISLKLFLKHAKIKYDWNLRVKLSDRRFKQIGFLKTISGWSFNSVKAIFGYKSDLSGYSIWRKKK